jgi:hypothetical protein
LAVGVTVVLVTLFATLTVYKSVPEAKAGDRVPAETVRAESVASLLGVVCEAKVISFDW